MARNLIRAGHDVVGFNRSHGPVEAHVVDGGRAAGSVAEAVTGASVVITMLPDSPDVLAVADGEAGIFAAAKAGVLYIDMSTTRPDVAADLAARGTERGLRVLDAPVSGGEQGAIDGTLSIMVGGAAGDFEAAQLYLTALGKTIVHVGLSGGVRRSRRPTS